MGKTLKSLARTYLKFYQGKLDCSIHIYDSKYTDEMEKDLDKIDRVEYLSEPKGHLKNTFDMQKEYKEN